jgi:4-hydroxyphenylpyruvate dioxygenase-like putative hemolysin
MRLDHIAYRVSDRKKTSQFFIEAFGYQVQQEFDIDFPDGTKAQCIALEPPEKINQDLPWTIFSDLFIEEAVINCATYHLAPEIFVSDGPEGSIIGDWVKVRGGIGGIHHIAYQVEDVRQTMKTWVDRGWAEFTTKDVLTCPEDELDQIFTKPNPLTGVIYEFIKRGSKGFCNKNVERLMTSTKGL